MKTIKLTQGKVALVDDADFDAVNKFKWHAHKRDGLFYAVRNIRKPDGRRASQSLHQFLFPGVPEVNHKDGNGLNNQRENLQPCTHLENMRARQRKRVWATSTFRGVSRNTKLKKWQASIRVNGVQTYLGVFAYEMDAARAYDTAARKYFGKFASPNFI